MLFHELKKFQLQERFTFMTHDSIGHLKTLFKNISSPSGGGVWVWMETLLLIAQHWENASILVWIQL